MAGEPRHAMANRLEGAWLDAGLHLLDRQVVDVEGQMVCNVDDLEITETTTGELSVTGLLAGPAALVPRFSGRLGGWLRDTWVALGVQYAGRDVPLRLGLDLVESVGSEVRLRVERTGLLDRQPQPGPGVLLRRMDDLLGMRVELDGTDAGRVIDVRIEPRHAVGRLTFKSLIVGRGRPGSMLGYDRGDFNGPWLVNAAVTFLHRHTGELPIEAVQGIDWERAVVTARGRLRPLRGAGST